MKARLIATALATLGLTVQGCAIPRWSNETTNPLYRGDFEVGEKYRLIHGAYVIDHNRGFLKLDAPTRYGLFALGDAGARFGDAREAPRGFASKEAERSAIERGNAVHPPVEDLAPEVPLPEPYVGLMPAGTTLQLIEIRVRHRRHQSVFYLAKRSMASMRVGRSTCLGCPTSELMVSS